MCSSTGPCPLNLLPAPLLLALLKGVQPREPSAEPAGAGPGSSSSGGSSGSGGAGGSSGAGSRGGSPPRVPYPFVNAGREAWAQEWHPNARPGLLELPSRLFSSSGGGGV